jgi:undecaprenyl-diphosphatase
MNSAVLVSDNSVIVTFLASFLIWFMLGSLAFLWIIDGRIKREQALHAFLSGLSSWVISMMIKSLFPSIRPFGVLDITPLTVTIPSVNSSFPSVHAAVAFAIATSIWLHNKKLGVRFIVLAFLVALGRVLSEVHFIHDVVAGALIGILTGFVVKKLHTYKLID